MSSFIKRSASLVPLALMILQCHAADLPPNSQPDLDQLVAHLNSEDFDERNTAMQKIAAMGETAREALEKAAASNDAEVRIAATELLGQLGQTSLTLLVVDRDGKPISGAQGDLTALSPEDVVDDDPKAQKIATREDGTASVGKVDPGVYDLNIQWAKFTSPRGESNERVRLVPGSNRIIVTLSAGGTVQATALDADGKPLKDAKLALGALAQTSGADGKVRLENVPDGTYRALWTVNSQTIEGAFVRVNEDKLTEIPPMKLVPKTLGGIKLSLKKAGGEAVSKSNTYVSLSPVTVTPGTELRTLMTLYDTWMTGRWEPPQHTDETGALTLENLEPGKYRLLVRDFDTMPEHSLQYAPWIMQETETTCRLYFVDALEIKAGAPLELTLKPVSGGGMKGKITTDKGDPATGVSVGVLPERFAALAGLQSLMEFTALEPYSLSARVGLEGDFALDHIPPGTYTLAVIGATSRTFVFNLVVEEGKVLEVPSIKLEAPKVGIAQLKGKVLLPNGKPCTDAALSLDTAGPAGQANESTNEDGEFSFDLALGNTPGTPSKIKVIAAGFQPATLDLATPGLDLLKLEIHLKAQEYGGLKVSTVDEAGKPVAGVRIWPSNPNPGVKLHQKTSDTKGALAFTGLAAGDREFKVEKPGYLTPASLPVTVIAGKEDTAVTVTLHPGLKVSGHIELPTTVSTASAAVILTDMTSNADAWTTVNSKGEFTFTGLTPGDYLASAIAAGSLLDGEPPRISLVAGQPPPPALALKLLPHGAAAINLGTANCGHSIKLLPAEAFKHFEEFWYWYSLESLQNVDGSGRAEFTGAPGEYLPFVLDETTPGDELQRSTLLAFATEPVTLQPVKATADVTGLPAKDAKVATGTGTITLALTPDYPANVPHENLAGSVDVILVGSQAICSMAFTTPPATPIAIVGKPPADFQIDRQIFTARKLPAGEYKVLALIQDDRGQVIGQKVLATRSIKDGQSEDLGEIKLPIPKLTIPIDADDLDQADVDKSEGFKP